MTSAEEQVHRVSAKIGMPPTEFAARLESLRGTIEETILKALFTDRIGIVFEEHLRKFRKASSDDWQKEQGFLDGIDSAITQINEKL